MGEDTERSAVTRFRLLAVLALALGLTLALSARAVAQEPPEGSALAVDCEGNTRQIETDCRFGQGQEFTVSIHIGDLPEGGFVGVQVKLRWDQDIVDYRPTAQPAQEIVWPGCTLPLRVDQRAGAVDVEVDTAVLAGCASIRPQAGQPVSPSDYTGPVFLFTFACAGDGTSPLTLVSIEDDPLGSEVFDANSAALRPSLEDASVSCGGPAVQRPAPEVTVNPPAPLTTETPPLEGQPSATPSGPTATPGGPTSTPGGPTVTATQRAPTTPSGATGGPTEGDDDGGLPVWVWIIIVIALVAGAGGLGFVGWRRLRAGGASG